MTETGSPAIATELCFHIFSGNCGAVYFHFARLFNVGYASRTRERDFAVLSCHGTQCAPWQDKYDKVDLLKAQVAQQLFASDV